MNISETRTRANWTDMLFRKAVLYAIALALVLSGASAPPAHAIDFYEIQIYSTETDPLGHLQLELHSNSVTTATGTEAHQQIVPYQIHETVEATYGILPWAEIGQYFATARLDNGNYEYAGSRSKFHFGVPQTADWPVSLSSNLELDYMRRATRESADARNAPDRRTRVSGKFTLIGNFAFEKPFSGPGTHKGVTFEPSGEAGTEKLLWWLSPAVKYWRYGRRQQSARRPASAALYRAGAQFRLPRPTGAESWGRVRAYADEQRDLRKVDRRLDFLDARRSLPPGARGSLPPGEDSATGRRVGLSIRLARTSEGSDSARHLFRSEHLDLEGSVE